MKNRTIAGREVYADERVMMMTLEQEAAYLRLLWHCCQDGSIPADMARLARICKNMSARRFAKHIWPALCGCFMEGTEGRLLSTLRQMRARADQQMEGGVR
jgi:hypothetical protein